MKLLLPRIVLFGGILVSLQVRGDAPEAEDKRSISHLARTGQLPSPGKRYVAALAKNGELSAFTRPSWKKKLHELLEEGNTDYSDAIDEEKRYVGALAKAGDYKIARYRNDKRDDVDSLIDELVTAEELRLEALKDEILRAQEEQAETEDDLGEEKRSLSSLARSGSMPFNYNKRGIESLARNGDFPWSDGKRGGMRNRYHHKRGYNNDIKELIDSLSDDVDGYDSQVAKRNLASFAKSGGLSGLSYKNEKKDLFDDWIGPETENKRNIQSVFRNRMSPFVEGKRYLGAFFASNGRPPYMGRDPTFKRNIGSVTRGWGGERYGMGKRAVGYNDYDLEDNDDIAKRYVAALLRQGRLPVGNDGNFDNSQDDTADTQTKEDSRNPEEDKRHIGSIAAQSSYAMRKKKSVDFNEQNDVNAKSEKENARESENDIPSSHRTKREIYYDSSEEYPMPVLQNTISSDYDDIMSKVSGDGPSARNKRYFAVRGGGKIPGGRLPQIGSRRGSHNQNSGRRRGGH